MMLSSLTSRHLDSNIRYLLHKQLPRVLCDRAVHFSRPKMISSSPQFAIPGLSYTYAPNYRYYRNHAYPSQRLPDIVDIVQFEEWPQFHILAERAASQLKGIRPDQLDLLIKSLAHPANNLDFVSHAPEVFEHLSKIAFQYDSQLSGMRILAGEPTLTYGPDGGSHRMLHDIGMYTNRYFENIPPDTGIRTAELWSKAEDNLRPSTDESESLASIYNQYFSTYRRRNNEDLWDDCLLNQLSEAVLNALHTRSGWYGLYRESEAVFLQVDPGRGSEKRSLTVRVSNIYKRDNTLSFLSGFLAFFQACKVAEDTKAKQLSDIATMLMMYTARRYDRARISDGKHDASQRSSANGSVDEPALTDQISLTSEEREKLQSALSGETLLFLNNGELGRFFLRNCQGYLGCGASGYVVRSCVEGVNLAVKRWERFSWELHDVIFIGLEELLYEIYLYVYLHKHHSEVLGHIVPQPIAICLNDDTKEYFEEALVTTMVGEQVESREVGDVKKGNRKEIWTLKGEELSEQDVSEIKEEMNENYNILRRLGIICYDGHLRNSRVAKVENETVADKKWRIWTIDLGGCRLFQNGQRLDLESLKSLVDDDLP